MERIRCIECHKLFNRKSRLGSPPRFCSRHCYDIWYYKTHREKVNRKSCAYHKAHYIPHPLPRKYASDEEKKEHYRKLRKERYENNREYFKIKNREWYEKHKDDPVRKAKHRIAMKKYYEKRKLNEKYNRDIKQPQDSSHLEMY